MHNIKYFEVSARNNNGIVELFNYISNNLPLDTINVNTDMLQSNTNQSCINCVIL